MSIGLATKGVLCPVSAGGSGPYPVPVPGCPPTKETDVVGQLHVDADLIQEDVVDVSPGVYVVVMPDTPTTEEVLPTMRTYPLPRNL